MRVRQVVLVGAVVLLVVSATGATVIRVPADQPTIQAGLNVANSYDTVLVSDGVYSGDGNRDLEFWGKNIVLKSEWGSSWTFIDCGGSATEQHRAFWFHSGESSDAVVSGFTIANGYADQGGAIHCSHSSPTIYGNYFYDCVAEYDGGGIYCVYASPHILENEFTDNSSGDDGGDEGGGIAAVYCEDILIWRNVFRRNSSYSGGAIGSFDSRVTIRDNFFTENQASDGGAIGLCCGSSGIIDSNLFWGNTFTGHGGAVFCNSGANPTISHNWFTENTSGSPYSYGGAICCNESEPDILWNVIVHNYAGHGGGMAFRAVGSAVARNCTLFDNGSPNGGGVSADGYATPLLHRCIVAFGSSGSAVWTDGTQVPTLVDCDLYGNPGGDWVGDIASQWDFNMSADPMFCDTAQDYYYISAFSPCAPGVYPNEELIGAREPACDPFVCGDANADGEVNADDLDYLIAYYFRSGDWPLPLASCDLNCDGKVIINDILLLANLIHGYGPPPCCLQPPQGDESFRPQGWGRYGD